MNAKQDGVWYRSEATTYAVGNTLPIKMDFLQQARHMAAPEVAEIVIEIAGTVGGVTGGALGIDACKLIDNLRITDAQEWCNVSGQELRTWAQMELGDSVVDPTDIASAATSTTYRYLLPLPLELDKAERGRDTRVELDRFLAGGEFSLSTPSAVPTGYNPVSFASGTSTTTVRVYFRVVDGRVRELKSRLTIRSQQIVSQDYEYECNGLLRAAILGSKLTTTSASSWASFTSLYSRSLDLAPNWPADMLRYRYRRQRKIAVSSTDVFLASTPLAIPLVAPDLAQKIGAMPLLKTLHVDLTPSAQASPPTNARLLLVVIKDRDPTMAALVAGAQSPEQAGAMIEARGFVVDGKPGGTRVTQYLPELARKLPVRIK